jgi:hypothetical protein
MGTTKQVPSAQWKLFFDRFSRQQLSEADPRSATVEVLSPEVGDQYEVLTTRLRSITYDPARGEFSIQLEDIEHRVTCPAEVWVIEEENGFLSTLELACPDGRKEILYLSRSGPLAPQLPDPLAP